MTVRRITAGELLKYRKGLRIPKGRERLPAGTSAFSLTEPLMVLAGLLVGVAPSSYPLIAVASGFTAGESGGTARWTRGLTLSAGFVTGIALVDAVIGALFGLFGFLVMRVLAEVMIYAYLALGLMLAVVGLALLRVVRIKFRLVSAEARPTRSFASAFLLGLPFGLSTCPACTPLLLPVLMAAGATGDPWMGAALLLAFGVARGVPIIAVGTAASALARMRKAMFWVPRIERVGGVLLLAASIWFLYRGGIYAGWWPPVGSTPGAV